jgi:hypothetical protein
MQEKIADRASILVILLSHWELRAKVVCGLPPSNSSPGDPFGESSPGKDDWRIIPEPRRR